MMTKKKWIIGGITAGVLAVGITAAVLHMNQGSSAEGVLVTPVADMTGGGVIVADRFSGVTEAQASVDFKQDASKKIAEVYVTLGQQVAKGDKLFAYDTADAKNNIETANLDIEGLNNSITQLNEDITELQKQRANASQGEQYQYTADIQGKQMDIRQAQFDIQAKKNDIAKYQDEIDHATVTSTIDGSVEALNPDGGMDTMGNEKPIVSVTQTGEFRIKGKLDEQSLGILNNGQTVIVRSRIDETKTWTGTITSIETKPVSDNNNDMYGYGSGESASSYAFYVSLDDGTGLMLGQHVYIEPDYGQNTVAKDGLWLDLSYVVQDEEGSNYVWIEKKGRLHRQEVTLGEQDDEMYTVEIKDGITENDLIAWPDETCTEGAKVMHIEDLMGEME